jgi:large subunit ribosomal protein L30
MSGALVVLRVRGRTHVVSGIADTMRMLSLTRKNTCVIVPDRKEMLNMVKVVKDYITWGEVDEKTVELLLKERGRIAGDKKLTDTYVKENSKFKDIKSLAAAVVKGEAALKDVKGLKSFFRLNPPRKGFEREGIKAPYTLGGALGNRGEKIKDLIGRMV